MPLLCSFMRAPTQHRLEFNSASRADLLEAAFHGPGFGCTMRTTHQDGAGVATVRQMVHGSDLLAPLDWAPLLQGISIDNAITLAMHHATMRNAGHVESEEDDEGEDDEGEDEAADEADEDSHADGDHVGQAAPGGAQDPFARAIDQAMEHSRALLHSGRVSMQLSWAINALALAPIAGRKERVRLVQRGTASAYARFVGHVMRVAGLIAWTALQHHDHQQQQQQQADGRRSESMGNVADAMPPLDHHCVAAALGAPQPLDIAADETLERLTSPATLSTARQGARWAHLLHGLCQVCQVGDADDAARHGAHALLLLMTEPTQEGHVSLLEQALRLSVFVVRQDTRLSIMEPAPMRGVSTKEGGRGKHGGGGGGKHLLGHCAPASHRKGVVLTPTMSPWQHHVRAHQQLPLAFARTKKSRLASHAPLLPVRAVMRP